MLLRSKISPAMSVVFAYLACTSISALAGFEASLAVDVPALDEYGLLALAGLLAVAGGITLARRNKKK